MGTAVEDAAAALSRPVAWHAGFVLDVADLGEEAEAYRGARHVAAARRIAVDGRVTPRVLGEARVAGVLDADGAKRVWHLLARFGARGPGGCADGGSAAQRR